MAFGWYDVLMPPENTNPQQTPANQFDFILKNTPKPPRKFSFLPKLSKPVSVGLVLVLVIIILFAASYFAGRGDATVRKNLVELMGRSQEITRVSKQFNLRLSDPEAKSLAATTETTLTSTQSRISSYMKRNKIKFSTKDLGIYVNKKSDAELNTAIQNNELDSAYLLYVSNSLKNYQSALQKVAKQTKSQRQLEIMNDAFESNNVILSSSAIKAAGS